MLETNGGFRAAGAGEFARAGRSAGPAGRLGSNLKRAILVKDEETGGDSIVS